MKSTLIVLVAFLLLFPSLHIIGQEKGIQFEMGLNWAEIKAKAKEENKNIFVDVYATWCGPCKMMDVQVYPNEELGELINEKFVSVKVQQDQTQGDNAHIKSWYKEAKDVIQTYKVDAFPSYLFLNADGRLIHRALGFQDVPEFRKTVEFALTDPVAKSEKTLSDYRAGNRDYSVMLEMIAYVQYIKKDKQLCGTLAQDYKRNYLEKIDDEQILTKENIDFIGEFVNLINSDDRLFKLMYEQPERVDQVMDYTGWADARVNMIIKREEIDSKIWKDAPNGIPNDTVFQWDEIVKTISLKFPKVDAGLLVLDNQMNFYGVTGDYRRFADCIDEKIIKYPPQPDAKLNEWGPWALNVSAWNMFKLTNDTELLNRALSWANFAIELDSVGQIITREDPNVQIYDTKANLLYKLGRVEEAIAEEEKAIQIDISNAKRKGREKGGFYNEYMGILKKMRSGIPTWPVEK